MFDGGIEAAASFFSLLPCRINEALLISLLSEVRKNSRQLSDRKNVRPDFHHAYLTKNNNCAYKYQDISTMGVNAPSQHLGA